MSTGSREDHETSRRGRKGRRKTESRSRANPCRAQMEIDRGVDGGRRRDEGEVEGEGEDGRETKDCLLPPLAAFFGLNSTSTSAARLHPNNNNNDNNITTQKGCSKRLQTPLSRPAASEISDSPAPDKAQHLSSSRFLAGAAWLLWKSEKATRERREPSKTATSRGTRDTRPLGLVSDWLLSSNTLQGLFGLVDRSARTLRRCTHASAWLPGGGNTYKRARASSVRYERRKLPRAALTFA
ncbi:hypothetical protein TESG_03258 [Trichophyton tonsurans CBS 112818]|uniref:Uncharacterized protein n=1 Tax=Trichophyton tonsurans (strain CBS 112818) TaxID=647933 RepID=F2RWU3_TRIT1|nr:hypothetical protein TESG_03258 [Trichophyton tonsurans CBS 112818]